MVTSQITQDGPALPAASGMPGTPSNLPRPAAKPTTGASNYARHTENVTYQTSRVVKHTRLPQGAIKRISLSVLVDHTLRWEAVRSGWSELPPPEKLESHSRPGGRGSRTRYHPRGSTGGRGFSVRVDA